MKPFFRLAFLFCALAFLFSSCNKSNEVGKMIPKTAMFVAQVNTNSLGEKLSWNDIKQTTWYKQAYSDSATKDWMKKILDNPDNTGIDFKDGLIFFADKNSGNEAHMVFEGSVKSETDFEQFNKNIDPNATATKDGDITFLILKDKSVVGSDGKHFAYVTISKIPSASDMKNWTDSTNHPQMSMPNNSDELSAVCKSLFSLKSDSSLVDNEKFANLLKETGDVHVWQNTEAIMSNSPSLGMLGMLKLDVFFKDNISTYTLNFENGKIDINQKGYAGKEFTDVLKKLFGGKINTDMIKNIPSQDVTGIFAMNFNPEGIKELIQLTGADGIINTYAQQLGFNLDDVVKANNGNLMFAFTDFKMKPDSSNYTDDNGNGVSSGKFSKPDFNYIFSLGIGDKASFQKILAAGEKVGSQMGKDSIANYAMNDKIFALGTSHAFASQYLAGSNNKFDFTDKISGHPVGFFIDFHKILTEVANETNNKPDAKAMMDASLKIWNNLFMTGGDYSDGAFTANTEINLVDQSTNSLKQLSNYFDELAKIHKARKERMSHSDNLDSLLTPPPIDTVKVK